MGEIKVKLLTDKLFMAGLVTLLMNDLFFKYHFSGLVTGKLSDISGLFIFPFFWCIFFVRHKLIIYIATLIIFVFWKLPVSTDFIEIINQSFKTRFYRVADATDLLTLLVMPFSYWHLTKRLEQYEQSDSKITNISRVVILASAFAFIATTLPRHEIKTELYIGESYVVQLNKSAILRERMMPASGLSDSIQANLVDSLFIIHFNHGRVGFKARVSVHEIGEQNTKVEFLVLYSYTLTGGLFNGVGDDELEEMKDLDRDDYVRIFKHSVIDVLADQRNKKTRIYYSNPKLDPRILD